jgi:hypothetical protein
MSFSTREQILKQLRNNGDGRRKKEMEAIEKESQRVRRMENCTWKDVENVEKLVRKNS